MLLSVPFALIFIAIVAHILIADRRRVTLELGFQVAIGLCLLTIGVFGFLSAEPLRLALSAGADIGGQYGIRVRPALVVTVPSALLLAMLGVVLPLVFIWLRATLDGRGRSFFISAHVLTLGLVGAFLAESLLVFYVFFEISLIGAYFWLGIHGNAERGGSREVISGALTRFLLFTLLGSLAMLASIAALMALVGGDVALTDLRATIAQLPVAARFWTMLGFLLAFAVKMPLFPLHGWMRETYHGSPPVARAVLSAAMSKLGAYGFTAILCAGYAEELRPYGHILRGLAVAGVLYGALLCVGARTFRDVLIYSSLAHLNIIALGVFAGLSGEARDASPLSAAYFQMFNHGLILAVLFALEARISQGADADYDFTGLREKLPRLTAVLLIGIFVAISLPGAGSFAAELLILFATFRHSMLLCFLALLGLLLAAIALVRVFHRVFLGVPQTDARILAGDLNAGEAVLGLCVAAIWVATGLYPMGILHALQNSIHP